MEIGKEFVDQKGYNTSMGRAIDDKLFFLDKLKLKSNTIFVDFGCADGTILQELASRFPGGYFIGFDISESMIAMAREKWNGEQDVIFTTNWASVQEQFRFKAQSTMNSPTTILILSSVLHELYSYGTTEDIRIAWERIFGLRADYIVFRDMMWSSADDRIDVRNLISIVKSESSSRKHLVRSFEQVCGPIAGAKSLTHYLLKYRYTVNWDREVHENYFPITLSQFLKQMTEKYEPEYLERTAIPFLQDCIRRDYGFGYPIKTHLKGIFKRKS